MKQDTPSTNPNRPRTVLGFDYGKVRIGTAIGQELLKTARPLVILQARDQRPDWPAIARLIDEWRPDLLVVGVPRHADASRSSLTAAALRFGRQLRGRYSLPVELIDEHLSSWAASQALPPQPSRTRATRDDARAAAMILETWFEHQDQAEPLSD
ncbi:MAG: Holliday junction resolvase RuvX [Gammaproteobacteria bacterium]|nr:Holliday junction resolvase RuvX [Gammaproteobacteria bacterium]MCP5458047.1 Holliday junction resolvase RuvX [Gammaproteobacteria bacterium]